MDGKGAQRTDIMNTKILFTDLDGTLLNDKKEITPGNQAAIDRALSLGHKIVISTGRPLASARIQAERLGLTKEGCYAITYNGGQIYDTYRQKTLYGRPVPRELIRPVFEEAYRWNLHIQTYSATHVLTERDCPEIQGYTRGTLLPYQVVADVNAALSEAPYKLLAIDEHDHAHLEAFRQKILADYSGILDSFFSSDIYLEIVPVGISKGFAVKWMCDYLGIPITDSVAAGDAQNDIAMLEAAHVGAVMRNASPDIARHGTYVTQADNNHDGVAEIIHRFILGDI